MNAILRLSGLYGPDRQGMAVEAVYMPQENGDMTILTWDERKDKPGQRINRSVVVLTKPQVKWLKGFLNNLSGV